MLQCCNFPTAMIVPVRYVALLTLTVQNSASILVMRHSRTLFPLYRPSTAVLLGELLKTSISAAIHIIQTRQREDSLSLTFRILLRDALADDAWKLAIPAGLYAVMNNLIFVAATLLDAATFQVTYQMKILTTAGFAVLILGQHLSVRQWQALLMLTAGIAMVQLSGSDPTSNTTSQDSNARIISKSEVIAMSGTEKDVGSMDDMAAANSTGIFQKLLGLFVVLFACLLSGLSGVYFEKILKSPSSTGSSMQRPKPPPSLWLRNVQLGIFSLPPACIIQAHSKNASTLNYGACYVLSSPLTLPPVDIVWVKAHNGNPLNELTDSQTILASLSLSWPWELHSLFSLDHQFSYVFDSIPCNQPAIPAFKFILNNFHHIKWHKYIACHHPTLLTYWIPCPHPSPPKLYRSSPLKLPTYNSVIAAYAPPNASSAPDYILDPLSDTAAICLADTSYTPKLYI